MESHHGPLSNTWMLVSIFGLVITLFNWNAVTQYDELLPWMFLLLVFFIIMFLSSFISAVRAPLDSDHDIHLAVHERYKRAGKYPDTDLHHGMIPKKKKTIADIVKKKK